MYTISRSPVKEPALENSTLEEFIQFPSRSALGVTTPSAAAAREGIYILR